MEATQAKAYVLPEGWDTRDAIADDLGCSPDYVRKLLGPAIKTGTVEFKQLPIWDKTLKRVRVVPCYHRTGR